MNKRQRDRQGFTLIELLTVIAIIGILASLTAAVLPRALERARITRAQNAMQQVQTALATYLGDHGSYPPSYGYLKDHVFHGVAERMNRELEGSLSLEAATYLGTLTPQDFVTEPYLWKVNLFGNFDMYDTFSTTGDTDRDGQISLLEFSPLGNKTGPSSYTFNSTEIYNGSNLGGEVQRQLQEQRPLLYIPVNTRQVELMARFWSSNNAFDPRPRPTDDLSASPISRLIFPPPKYDAYVLISVGPDGTTRGLIPPLGTPPGNEFAAACQNLMNSVHPNYRYHILGLAAYYMASRDANGNGELDFDFLARTRGAEAKAVDDAGNLVNLLPDPAAPAGQGPLIKSVK